MRADPARPVPVVAGEVAALSRWVRLPGFCAASVLVGVGGHQVAHGTPPTVPTLTLALALVAMTWYAVSRRELGAARLTLIVWLSQVEVHLAMTPGGHGAHHASGPVPHTTWSWQMLLWHALAGLVVALWLRRGESATWRLIRRLVHRQLPHLASSLPAGPRQASVVSHRGASLYLRRESRRLSRRGPPTLSHA